MIYYRGSLFGEKLYNVKLDFKRTLKQPKVSIL
jgi:hypothetical protein